jgi:hypothetical protein
MTATASKTQVLLARMVVVLAVAFSIFAVGWNGLSAEVWQRVWQDLFERPHEPMTFRFVLQPAMATIAALKDGIKDARNRRAPYLWAVLTNPRERGGRLWEGLISTARIILLGLCMDAIYQFIVLQRFYPGEALIIAILLAFVPYLLLRGPIARIARWLSGAAPVDGIRSGDS